MPDGQMRRAPQLWEQRLARTTSILGAGISSSGDATAIVPPSSPPGAGGGTEPAPVAPAPGLFIAPSAPTLSGTVQGIRVSWNGNNSSGDTYPAGAYVEIHISTTGATFTPSSSTLAGRLLGSAGFFTIGALTAGTTYYVRLVGVDEAGNTTSPSTAASSQTGLTTSSDYGTATITSGAVSFNARQIGGISTTVGTSQPSSPVTGDIWLDSTGGAIVHKRWDGSSWVTQAWGSSSISANAITATQIAAGAITAGAIAANAITAGKIDAGAITADKIAASTITGDKIAANTIDATKISASFITASDVNGNVTSISGSAITSGTITGRVVQSSNGNARIVLNNADTLDFFSSGVKRGDLYGVTVSGFNGIGVTGALDVSSNVYCEEIDSVSAQLGTKGANRAFRVDTSGDVYSYGIDGSTTGSAANVRVEQTGSRQLVRSTSTERVKTDIVGIDGDLEGVNPDKIGTGAASVDPWDVLALTPAEFQSLSPVDQNQRMFGFIAENVAAVFPFAAEWDEDGLPSSVSDRPILAALLAVVKDQAATIEDLRTRIEALEA